MGLFDEESPMYNHVEHRYQGDGSGADAWVA